MIPNLYQGKRLIHTWDYLGPDGSLLGHVARFEDSSGKTVVPFFRPAQGGFDIGGPTESRPLYGGDLLAASPGRAVFILEGEKCASAMQSLGFVAVASQGGAMAAGKTDWEPLRGRQVFILPDNDEPGENYARDVARLLGRLNPAPTVQVVRLPDLPPAGDVVDWIGRDFPDWDGYSPAPAANDMKEALEAVIRTSVKPVPDDWSDEAKESAWETPAGIEAAPTPSWPDSVFPGDVQNYVTALSESTETPPELAGMVALAVLATVCQGRYRVRIKPDYFEPLQLWPACVLEPGNRKSEIFTKATSPLSKWETWQKEQLASKIAEAESEHATITERIKHLRAEAKKAKGEEFDKLKREIRDTEQTLPEIPTYPQLWAADVTPEHLGTIMAENEQRMAILSDEGGIFDTIAGRYSGGVPNLDLFLQGHAGSPVRVNRGSRPPVSMNHPCLTVGLTPQPDVIRSLSNNPGFRGRGLLARFLFTVPRSLIGERTGDTPFLPVRLSERWERIVTAILAKATANDDDGNKVAHVLKLSPGAWGAWRKQEKVVELMLADGGLLADIRDWGGKLMGATARIAAVLHCARFAEVDPTPLEIGIEDMEAALRLAKCLTSHALIVFDMMGAEPALDDARRVLKWIQREQMPEFTFRNCHYAHKTRFKRAEDLEPAMNVLEERGYIRRRMEKVSHRPSKIYEVNPLAFTEKRRIEHN